MRRLNGWIALCALVAAFIAPVALAGESAEPFMWLSWARVKPGGQDTFLDVMRQAYGLTLDRLMESGEVIGWGVAAKANHDAGPSHIMWITVDDWAAMDAVFEAIDADFKARSSGELERLFGALQKVSDWSAHFDSVARHTSFNWEPGGDVAPKYIMTGTFTVLPGADFMGLYNEYILPIYKELRSNGVVHSFGMYEPFFHDGSGITHVGWAFLADLSKIDEIEEAFAHLDSNEEFGKKLATSFDMSTHRDYLWEVLHLGGMPIK